jgi:hypothetical protein
VFYEDTGMRTEDVFSEFNPEPIGVASLAQVHVATHRATGQKVAVKIQHPPLQEFAAIEYVFRYAAFICSLNGIVWHPQISSFVLSRKYFLTLNSHG